MADHGFEEVEDFVLAPQGGLAAAAAKGFATANDVQSALRGLSGVQGALPLTARAS
jgi:hypothetical protein